MRAFSKQLGNTKKTQIFMTIMLLCVGSLVKAQVEDPLRTFCSNFCESCYWQTDICQTCGERFYFHEFFKVCLQGSMLGCKSYASRSVCAQCDQGYKNVLGTCQSCSMSLCGVCERDINTCDQCRTGFSFSGLVASSSTCTVVCNVENCQKCYNGSGSFCEICLDGYRKTPSDSCEKCTLEGCKSCTAVASTCDNSCLPGYYWFNNKCEKCMTGCKTCSSQGLCDACDTTQNYFMDVSRTCVKFSRVLQVVLGLVILAFGLLA